MDYLNTNIAINLKKIRQTKNLSLDAVAEQTGVSKSMLGQIERKEANPTIGILGKIVSGLRVELDDLVCEPRDITYTVEREKLIPTKEVQGEYTVYSYFPFERYRKFEIYVISIQKGASYVSGGHGEHTEEYVMVNTGELELKLDEEVKNVKKGNAIRFNTGREHIYRNIGEEELEIICVFSF